MWCNISDNRRRAEALLALSYTRWLFDCVDRLTHYNVGGVAVPQRHGKEIEESPAPYFVRSNVTMLRVIPFSGQLGITRHGVRT
jgi:hypothetical protein